MGKKRKGKPVVFPPDASGPALRQLTLLDCGASLVGAMEPRISSSLGSEKGAERSGSGATLSPAGASTLPQPGSKAKQEISESFAGDLEASFLSLEGVPAAASSPAPVVSVESVEVNGTPTGVKTTQKLCAVERPMVVTVDSLWEVIQQLNISLSSVVQQMVSENSNFKMDLREQSEALQQQASRMSSMETSVEALKAQNLVLIKDKDLIHRKLEMLENQQRKNNLRFLNFPKSPIMSSIEMVKKYCKEILQIPPESIPPMIKAIYITVPGNSSKKDQPGGASFDLTDFLESSLEIVTQRTTLVVTFAFETDRNQILRLFFRHIHDSFLGSNVRIFPDLSRQTQKRRQEFLELKPRVLALGVSYILRFPCCCSILYEGNSYLFYDPKQLSSFLKSKESSEQRVLPLETAVKDG